MCFTLLRSTNRHSLTLLLTGWVGRELLGRNVTIHYRQSRCGKGLKRRRCGGLQSSGCRSTRRRRRRRRRRLFLVGADIRDSSTTEHYRPLPATWSRRAPSDLHRVSVFSCTSVRHRQTLGRSGRGIVAAAADGRQTTTPTSVRRRATSAAAVCAFNVSSNLATCPSLLITLLPTTTIMAMMFVSTMTTPKTPHRSVNMSLIRKNCRNVVRDLFVMYSRRRAEVLLFSVTLRWYSLDFVVLDLALLPSPIYKLTFFLAEIQYSS